MSEKSILNQVESFVDAEMQRHSVQESLLYTPILNKIYDMKKAASDDCVTDPRQLTLDELWQREDSFIWIQDWSEDLPFKAWGEKRGDKITALIWVDGAGYGIVVKDLDDKYYRKLYGKEWAAYDRPPEGDSL